MAEEIIKSFKVSNDQLEKLVVKMEMELEKGLKKATNDEADIKQLPTFVTSTPDGNEEGQFLALDLGGTNFRILLVRITIVDGKSQIEMDNQTYFVPNSIMTGTGTQLFDFLANNLFDYLVSRDMMCQLLPIGFTFSFPTKNLSITKTVLVNWSKGYTASGVVGEDIGQLLNEAIDRRFKYRCAGFDLRIMNTVVNDTVGTMQAAAYINNNTTMGMIVGTGTNMCYMEKQENIEMLDDCDVNKGEEMCINTEWGAFGDTSGFLDDVTTCYDKEIDRDSPNPGEHKYEKMIGGMYLGEIVRRIIVDLHARKILFTNVEDDSTLFNSGLSTAFVSYLTNPDITREQVGKFLQNFHIQPTDEECDFIVELCHVISRRAAHLCAVGVVAVARKVARNRQTNKLTIGVDGSVYKKHPTFSKHLEEKVGQLAAEFQIEFQISNDGSGKGAALVAAVESRIHKLPLPTPKVAA